MKDAEHVHVLREILKRSATGRVLAQRLFADWSTWNKLKAEFVRQYCKNSHANESDIVISATRFHVER